MTEHADLKSSALRTAVYDDFNSPDFGWLSVTFTNGRTYTHERVPRAVWERLKNSSSPGRTYLDDIKGSY